MADRVRIYSRAGYGLCDLRVTAIRNWMIGREGEAEFDLVTNDRACRDDYLLWGNWLLIENDKLEPWIGMLDEPQEWRRFFVHVRAYTPDRLLAYRNVPRQLRLSGKSGNVFTKVINLVNRAEATIIRTGSIWTGGMDLSAENMSGDNLQQYLFELAKRANAEFDFIPVPFKGNLYITANWYQKIGTASNYLLAESYNLSDEGNSVRVQGHVTNQLWGYGSGAGQTDRPSAIWTDASPIGNRYGLRQGTRTYSDYSNAGVVLTALKNEINVAARAKNVFKLSMIDIGTAWRNLRKGNIYPLRMWSVKFGVNTLVRVVGMLYNPFNGRVELKLEEQLSDSAQ